MNCLNNINNLGKKKNDLKSFFWGFREYFLIRFPHIEDEKIAIECLNSVIGINSALNELVYLIFKTLNDKLIQKSLRIYLKNIAQNEDHEAVLNLIDHFFFWKEMNFTKVGSDREKFSLDFLIQKQLDNCIDELGLDKDLLVKLTN